MDQRNFIRSLSAEKRRQLTTLTSSAALIRLCVLLLLLYGNTIAILSSLPGQILFTVFQGVLIVSLFHLLHECVHDTVFKVRWQNRLTAHLCGFVLFLPSMWFRYFHFDHHRFTQIPGKDPELDSRKPVSLIGWLIHVTGVIVWLGQARVLFGALSRPVTDRFIPKAEQLAVRIEMWLMLFGYLLLFLLSTFIGSTVLWQIWLLPLLFGQPFLRLYLLAEHSLCETSDNMFLNTRTVLTNPILRWFTWNMPYHTEHHVFPAVPFHRLPELHKLVHDYIAEQESSYLSFNRKYVKTLLDKTSVP